MSSSSLVRPGLTTAIVGHLPAIKLRLRKKVPQLTFVDVRRSRFPFYEALASDLYESGCINAAFLLFQLIEFEHDYVPQTSDPAIEGRRLKNSKKHLIFLFKSLRDAEGCKNEQQYEQEIEHLLRIARWFQDNVQKRWLGRQFFLISFDRCKDCSLEELRAGVLAKYYYGMFLLATGHMKEAIEMLDTAKNQARGQHWTVDSGEDMFGHKPLLINEIYRQLYLAYLRLGDHFKKTDSHMFDRFMRLSHEHAIQSNLEYLVCESYIKFGDFLLEQKNFHEALHSFKQASKRAKRIYANELICRSNVRIAALHWRFDEPIERDYSLRTVRNLTADDRKSECYAELQLLTSEMHLDGGRPSDAIKGCQEACNIYKRLRNERKMMQACCLEAAASAGQYFGRFVKMTMEADFYGPVSENKCLFKLLRWTTDGEPFW